MTETNTCHVEGKKLFLCYALKLAAEPDGQGTKRQGVKYRSLYRMADGSVRDALSIVSGELKHGGIMNFCPFCGADITTQHDAMIPEMEK